MPRKSLRADAPAWAPASAAGLAGPVSAATAAVSTTKAGDRSVLTVVATTASCVEANPPAPNGLAELANVLSGDLTFDDIFDHGSRRGSGVGGLAEGVDEDEPDSEGEGQAFHDAAEADEPGPPSGPEPTSDDGSAGSGNSDATAPRSCPVAITAPARASAEEVAAIARAQQDLAAAAGCVQAAAATDAGAPRLGPQDFEILRVVGQGAFGKVFQVRARATGRVYAMKVMRKEVILQKDHGDYVRAERDLLTAVVHPYIVTLRYSFQTPAKLYLVLDFINGGHLFFNLYRQGVFDEAVARLYCAEIVSALAYLHARGIVHRDLKPENVLLDSDGHVRLTDFGLAKGNMNSDSRTNSFIGTMEYMAPEIIAGAGHGVAVDWWSAGVLLYEMLAGVPPFRNKSRTQLQQQILIGKVKFPKFLSSTALSLLKGLLTRDPAQRLGSGDKGAAAVKGHAFFRGIDWAALEARRVESSFKPGVKCSLSVDNFDKIWTQQRPVDSPCGTPTDPAAAGAFAGFTYVAPSFCATSLAALAAARGAGAAQ